MGAGSLWIGVRLEQRLCSILDSICEGASSCSDITIKFFEVCFGAAAKECLLSLRNTFLFFKISLSFYFTRTWCLFAGDCLLFCPVTCATTSLLYSSFIALLLFTCGDLDRVFDSCNLELLLRFCCSIDLFDYFYWSCLIFSFDP